MMRAYSNDFRHSIVQAYEAGHGSQRQLARLFGVSLSCIQRLLQRYRQTGRVAPKPHGGGQRGKLLPYLATVAQLQDGTPDATVAELCEQVAAKHQVGVSPATMSRALRRLDRPRKKNVSGQGAGSPGYCARAPRVPAAPEPVVPGGWNCDR